MMFARSRSRFYDTIGGGHNIYTLDGGRLRAFDVSGSEITIDRPTWDANSVEEGSFDGVCWWRSAEDCDGLSGSVLLTNK